MSVYDAVGGSQAVRMAVDVFYRRVLADPDLARYFGDVDVALLSAHQRTFLAAALGGPLMYGGRSLAAAHEGLSVDDAAFDAVSTHLVATLRDLGIEPETVRAAAARIEAFRDDVVTVLGTADADAVEDAPAPAPGPTPTPPPRA